MANRLAGRAKILPTMFRRIAAVVGVLVLAGIAVFFYSRTAVAPGHLTRRSPAGGEGGRDADGDAPRRAGRPSTASSSNGFPTHLVSLLTDGRLVRVNPETDRAGAVAGRIASPARTPPSTSRCGRACASPTARRPPPTMWCGR